MKIFFLPYRKIRKNSFARSDVNETVPVTRVQDHPDFLPKKRFTKSPVSIMGRVLLASLTLCLVCSQIIKLSSEPAKSVLSQNAEVELGKVELYTSPLDENENVWVFVDGEKTVKIKDNKASITVESNATIEIMSYAQKDFEVSVLPAQNVTVAGNSQNIKCKKGINYICRCIVSQK